MAAMRLELIGRYLRPHCRTVIFGAIALVVVNVLSVTIPMEVRRVVDELQIGFAYDRVLSQAAWIVLLSTTMGAVRLLSRQLVFGVGRQVEVELRQRLFDHMLRQEPSWVQTTGSGDV
ncbi:MAG: ABC transporter transmembrane domain-containing protein, partial [Cyanobacteriota bacterium]|nr:ABC transporter transmembrane domain-containing protein [Cyanobacteriota bacterium]